MEHEKRKSDRTAVNVAVKLKQLRDGDIVADMNNVEPVPVNVVNISRDGIAFRTKESLHLNALYDTTVVFDNKERIDAVIEIVRMENTGVDETTYGCRFIGINSNDQFKIDVYQIVSKSQA